MRLRRATLADSSAVSDIHCRAAFLPPPHGPEENLTYIRDKLMAENEVWVADIDGEVMGYVAFNDAWLTHLFVRPNHQGQRLGPRLLDHAMADGRERQLWTFARNIRARDFYEKRGWVLMETTDGSGNAFGEPEVRYSRRPTKPSCAMSMTSH